MPALPSDCHVKYVVANARTLNAPPYVPFHQYLCNVQNNEFLTVIGKVTEPLLLPPTEKLPHWVAYLPIVIQQTKLVSVSYVNLKLDFEGFS